MCYFESHRDIRGRVSISVVDLASMFLCVTFYAFYIEEGLAFVLSFNGQTLSCRVHSIISMEPCRPYETAWQVAQRLQYKSQCLNKSP